MAARILLWILSLVYLARFAWPAWFGSAGAPFGAPWLTVPDGGTLLLDADLRYFGSCMAAVAVLFAMGAVRVERHLAALDLMLLAAFAGGLVRATELVVVGVPAPPGIIATAVELAALPAWMLATASVRKSRPVEVHHTIEVARPAKDTWAVFGSYANVSAWHPYMESASLDTASPSEGLGAARTCEFGPRMAIRETVVEWDNGRSMTIAIEFLRGMAPPIRDIRASVHVTPLGPRRSRLALKMTYIPKFGPAGNVLCEALVVPQYQGVFRAMAKAARGWAEAGEAPPQLAMPGSGRKL